jgi:predicted nucleotidyltransferase component of viral defense system
MKPPSMTRLKKIARNAFFSYDYPAEIDQIIDDERTIGFRIKIEGPLYKGKTSLSSIRIEISKRESVKNVPLTKEIAPPYSDILPYTLSIMDLVEISSEKVRAILTRNKARDLYDLHILIKKGNSPDLELVNQKLKYYDTEFTLKTFRERCKQLEKKWDNELNQLLGKTPAFKPACELVIKKVSGMKRSSK